MKADHGTRAGGPSAVTSSRHPDQRWRGALRPLRRGRRQPPPDQQKPRTGGETSGLTSPGDPVAGASGSDALSTKVKLASEAGALVPSGVVTVTPTVPAAWAGVTAVSLLSLSTWNSAAGGQAWGPRG